MKDIGDKNADKKNGTGAENGLMAKWKALDPARRDKLATRGITAIVILVIAAYLIFTMLPGRTASPGRTDPAQESAEQGQQSQDGNSAQLPGLMVDTDQDPVQSGGTQPESQIRDRGTDSDGFSYTGGMSMMAASLSGERVFTFNVPLGFMTRNSNNGTWVKPEGMDLSVQSSDPFRFAWTRPAGLDSLMEKGWYDFLSHDDNDGEILERYLEATDYYLSEKLDGTPLPVTLAKKTVRFDQSYETAGEDFDEYYIIADCGDGSYFVGSVDGRCLELMYSQRYPDFGSLARAMIPVSSEPGFPSYWTVRGTQDAPASEGAVPETDTGPESGEDARNTEE